MNVIQRWRLKAERFAWRLDQPRVMFLARWLVPLMFGLFSVKLGQDANWDFRNYHWYNAFAFLNGKVGVDLAPAQMQTYFNPTIDLLYYGLAHVFPGQAVSFIMGAIHGLNFILLTIIARELLPPGAGKRIRLPLLLALAGMFSNDFLSELGNTMGDNLVALAVLGAWVVMLRQWPRMLQGAGMTAVLGAGILMGVGVGLKLTVAVFALALCCSLLALPVSVTHRLRAALVFGIGVMGGMAIAGGHWFWKMWTLFGNPLFPQFNSVFHGPLAPSIAMADTRFLPRGLGEYLLWPFVFVFDPERVSELKMASPIWLLVYVAAAALLLKFLLKRRSISATTQDAVPDGRVRVMAVFFGVSYLLWMVVFSIYRYLVPLELLAPLMLWLLLQALLPRAAAGPVAALMLLAVIASNFPRAQWGYVERSSNVVSAEVPAFVHPEQSLVFTVHYSYPMGWLATLFPARLAFVGLGSNFPESAAYRQRVAAMIAARTGPFYAIFHHSGSGINSSLSDTKRVQGAARDATILAESRGVVAGYGMQLDLASCRTRPSFLGGDRPYYTLCQVHPVARQP